MPEGIFEFKGKEVTVGNYGGVAEGLPEIITTPLPNLSGIDGGPGKPLSFEESFKQRYNEAPGGNKVQSVPLSAISTDKRYKSVFMGSNPEEMHAQQQAWTQKAYRDTLKFGTLVGTTIAGGFGMVYGAGKWMLPGGKFSDIFSNPIMQGLDKINTAVDEALPNYYTEAEKNAEWFSKDNLFTANFLFDKLIKNSGFAVGAMLSGNIANGLIGAAGKGIGGLAAKGVANLAKGTTTLGETSTAFKLFTPILKNTARAFSVGENAAAANVLRTQATSIADMASQSTKLAAIAKEQAKFAKFNLAARRTAIAAYSSAGESSFEALQTSNTFRDKLLSDYFYENGKNPEGDDLAKIDDLSRRVGKMSFLSNMALLTVTEFQQLPYLAGSSFKKTRQAANELLGKVDDAILKEGKYVSAAAEATPSTRIGKLFKGVTDTGGALLRGKATYLFDPKEGLQELLQNAIQVGTENYYNKAYKGQEAEGIIDTFAEVSGYGLFGRDEKGEGVGALVSKEGLESALIGGLTGGPMQAMGTYSEKKQIKTHTANFLKELDNSPTLRQAFVDKIDSVNRGVQLQKDHEGAVLNNDKLESVDSMTDLMHNYLAPRIKYGKFDMIMQDLDELKASAMENNGEGLALLKQQGIGNIGDTIESFTKRINAVQEKAKSIQEMYEYMNLNYGGQTMTGPDGKEYLKYSSDVIDKMVYATTKIADYDKRLPELAASLTSSSILVDPIVAEVIKESKVDLLNEGVKTIASIDDPIIKKELEQKLLDSVDLGMRRKKFINELNDIIASPEKYKPVVREKLTELTPEGQAPEKIIINIKDPKGTTKEKEIEIGVDYLVGRIVEYDKKGNEVYRAVRIKILGKTEDGKKLRIQDVATGTITEVSPEKLEDYQLGKASDATKKQIWVANNWNRIFQHRGIKNKKGVPVEGRIENHPKEGMVYFVYKNDKGVIQKIPVKNSDFVAKKGYKRGMIAPKQKLVATEQQTLEEIFSAKERAAQSLRQQAIDARNEVILELYDESVQRIEEINKELDKTQKSIESVEKQLAEEVAKIPSTKKGVPSKRVAKALRQTIDALGKSLESLRTIEADLQSERETVEASLPYIQSFIDELTEAPEDNNDLIAKLKGDVSILKDLAKITTESIDKIGELYKTAESLLQDALEELNDFIKELKEKNPNMPIFIEDLQANVERFLGEQGAEQYIQDRLGFTNQVREFEDQITDLENYLELPGLTKNADKLRQSLSELKEGLQAFRGEQAAKEAIIEKFEAYIEKEKQKKEEEEKVAKNKKIQSELLGTADSNAIQNEKSDGTFESDDKKPNNIIPEATITTGDKPHAVRSNAFGANMNSFENRDEVRGVHITSKNEDDLIPGLTDHLRKDDDDVVDQEIDGDKIIALVMVDSEGNLLDVNGKKIETIREGETKEQYDQRVLDTAIYQVMPLEKLQWGPKYGNKSMFREGTSEQYKDEVRKKYAAWRNETLEQSNVGPLHTVDASFGRAEMVQTVDEKGNLKNDYTAKTSVQSAGLISEEDLATTPLIHIPKTNATAAKKTTSFKNALGQVFLELSNGFVKLRNRQHNEKEAKVIFDSLVMLSKYMMDKSKGLKSDEAVRLLTFLKSSVYWGIPETQQKVRKAAGYNSVFFERDPNTGRMMLNLSGKGMDFVFTPSGLLENEDTILGMLEGMYKNVNSYMTQNLNESYEEITGIGPDGEVKSNIWPNYQTYLLSNKNANGSERAADEIPVTTLLRPLEGENDVNRKNIYFFTTDNADTFATTVSPEKAAPAVITPGMPKGKAAKAAAPAAVQDGKQVLIDNIQARKKAVLANAKTEEEKAKINEDTNQLLEIINNAKVGIPGQFVLDGETLNIQIGNTGNMIVFTAESGITAENYNDKIKIKPALGDVMNIVEIVKKQLNVDQDGAVDNVKKSLATMVAQQEAAPVAAPAPSQEEFDEFEPYVEPVFEEGVQGGIDQASQNAGKPVSNSVKSIINSKRKPSSKKARREVIVQDLNKFKKEDWNKVERWIKAVLPNIPVYRVKNVIQATNGKQAWGMFHNGAVYIYENAQVGTAYHEVFHAIWRMFTDTKEQEAIYNEFKNRSGKFFDRTSGQTINYAEATIDQMEEALAEEFRDYVHEGKKPGKPSDGRPFILKMFSDLVNFIKKLFLGKESASLVEELFKNINQGSYKASMPFSKELGYASKGIIDIDDISGDDESAFSLVEMGDIQRNEILQEMTYQTLLQLIDSDQDLFDIPNIKRSTIYEGLYGKIQNMIAEGIDIASELMTEPEYQTPELQKQLQDEIANITQLMQQVEDSWESIMDRHQEYLRGYSITFDENDELALNDDEKSKEDPFGDSTKIDHFKKANAAIKLLLSTVPMLDENGDMRVSSVGGAILMPVSQTYISVMNNVHNSNNIEDMLEKLRQMAVYDQTYAVLYDRITKSSYKLEGLDLSKVKTVHGAKLIDAFFNTFKKQNPDVKNVFILSNGEIVVGEANLSSAASQLRAEYINQIITKAKEGKGFFKYNTTKQVYEVNSDKLKKYQVGDAMQMLSFLKELGVDFTGRQFTKLNDVQASIFRDAVSGIRSSIANAQEIKNFSSKTLDMEKRLFQLGLLKASIDNPQFDSTFFNVSGERTQSFVGTNAASNLFTFLSNLTAFTKDQLAGTNFAYLGTDSFVEGSSLLKRKYTADGKIISGSEDLGTVGYVGGIVNETNGKTKSSAKLDYKNRLIQELNLNLKGWYLNLVPGDASLEWMIKMGNPISAVSLTRGFGEVHELFKGYFLSELKLAREGRPIANVKGRSTNDMRFFKSILGEVLHTEIINSSELVEEVYAQYEKKINAALDKFIETQKNKFVNTLVEYGIAKPEGYGYTLENLDLPKGMIEAEFNRHMNMLTVNFFVANIEMHKLLYSDPYQYSDELKRIKNFNSSGQPLMNSSPKMNKLYNTVWNKGYKRGDIGYTNFTQEYFKTATHADVNGIVDLPNYDNYKETDGAGMISFKAHRQFRIRSSNWNSNEEAQYKYDVAWEKVDKGIKLNPGEQEIYDLGNPEVKSAYTPSKPIARGNKANGNNYNDVVLDKFALYPVSYRVMKQINPTSNMVKLYNKMQKENIDYIVFESSRKVGVDKAHATYNAEDSSFNETKYAKRTITNVPFSVLYVQAEVPSKDIDVVTRGSQVTKLITMDFLDAGVPIDFEIKNSSGEIDTNFTNRYEAWFRLSEEQKKEQSDVYKEIKNNEDLLVALIKNGYNNLLKTLGISNVNGEFKIINFNKSATTLRNEILKREVNDNISDALKSFLEGKAILEATPAYQQVRNILYSIADREVVSSKMPGGMKVQITSTLLESVRAKEVEVNGKKGLASDVLNFYEKDGKRVCEIMVGRWFKSDLSDDELLDLWYKKDKKGNRTEELTEEGEKILSGLAYRIPTQKQNSIDSYVIKQFLPKEFGDSVVIPAALVAKAGSDFDIDKLSIYFKNVKIGKDGLPKYIEFQDNSNSTVEERYVKYVSENTPDYKDIVKDFRESEEFATKNKKVDSAFETVGNERQKLGEVKTEIDDAYEIGYESFKQLPLGVKQVFWEVERDLREEDIDGLQKNLFYASIAEKLLSEVSGKETVTLEQIIKSKNGETKTEKVTVPVEEIVPHLEAMLENYKEMSALYGISNEQFQKITSSLANAKTIKEILNDRYKLEVAKVVAEFTNLDSLEKFGQRKMQDQNTRKALENAYTQSSQNLVSHPKNYDRLIQPNSAEQLKGLAKFVAEKTAGQSFDYTDVGNMLDRTFMSKLRHAFVSGKYAIGIAAVNQTNHSLNQRQPIFIDITKIKDLPESDRYWLGNGRVTFEAFNKLAVGGYISPIFSMARNAERSEKFPEGQDISDILAQFIDGYVDISKGPWIMELGATSNVASTWMTLVKLGVPIETVTYFMNQPIIRDYLKSVETAGYSYLFIDDFVSESMKKYAPKDQKRTPQEWKDAKESFKVPSKDVLKNLVGEDVSKMDKQQLETQQLMLLEFLKYAKMAEQMFQVTQGSNFDTATLNDPSLVFKKIKMLEKAQKTIISSVDENGKTIPGVDALLKNSFLGEMGESIINMREALAQILMSDRPAIRKVIEQVLTPYLETPDREFVKIAQKTVNDLFDWAIFTHDGYADLIKSELIKDGGTAKQIYEFAKEVKDDPNHPLHDNFVINILEYKPSSRPGDSVNNLKIKGVDNKTFDQNNIIGAFRQIRTYIANQEALGNKKDSAIYKGLVNVAILQSGLSNSPISYTSLLPYEDFAEVYNPTLSKLENFGNLDSFVNLGVFARNNWNSDTYVPSSVARWLSITDYMGNRNSIYNPSMYFLPEAVKDAVSNGEIPQVVTQSVRNSGSSSDYITFSWELQTEILTADELKAAQDKGDVMAAVFAKKNALRKAGDYSFIQRGLFQKVRDSFGTPLTTEDRKGKEYFVYKAINAWGDSFRANEFYDVDKQSVIENGMIKVNPASDNLIIDIFRGTRPVITATPSKTSEKKVSLPKENKPKGLPSIDRTNEKC